MKILSTVTIAIEGTAGWVRERLSEESTEEGWERAGPDRKGRRGDSRGRRRETEDRGAAGTSVIGAQGEAGKEGSLDKLACMCFLQAACFVVCNSAN